ncbi:MAG: hypothetical protein COW42_06195 [Deltaproteobacteria bacterium CG17_big_fil_post_rev_8_21_14_2_50_63_7]|nr:MAG: hypothetical protein COW42_06195 [Deltaproteobacteria bacterium CG17_big_fil_post_rev_8_21_14_2_50_63_7]
MASVVKRIHMKITGLILALTFLLVPFVCQAQDSDANERFDAVIGDALRAYNEGDFDRALDLYFEAKVINDLAEIDYSIARCYHKIGKCEAAKKFYDSALKRVSELPETYEQKINEHIASLPETCIPEKQPEEVKVVEVQTPEEKTPPVVLEPPTDWLSIGVMAGGGAVLLGGLGLDIASASLADEHKALKTDPATGTDASRKAKLDQLESDISTRKTIVIAMYGVGGAALITGTVLFFLRMNDDSASDTAWNLYPSVGDGSASVSLLTRW